MLVFEKDIGDSEYYKISRGYWTVFAYRSVSQLNTPRQPRDAHKCYNNALMFYYGE
jgi:hypothetical protein